MSTNMRVMRPLARRSDNLELLIVALMEHEKELSDLIEKMQRGISYNGR